MSIPSSSTSRARLAVEDCNRMARISAEYCLFWLMEVSGFWIRDTSHLIKEVSLPMTSAIDARDDRFSNTPRNGECTEVFISMGYITKHVVYASLIGFVILVQA